MSHIFISYSRRDLPLAQRIVDALGANQLDAWIDWKSIPKGEDWEQEIYQGIEGADAFLFLISSDSVTSEMCNKEIQHAIENGKRILPIFIADVENRGIYSVTEKFLQKESKDEINRRNFILCRPEKDDFEKAMEEVQKTIRTDYEWLKYHTELQIKALKWDQAKDVSRLSRSRELRDAEEQLAIIGLPSGVFTAAGAGVKTNLLFFTKGKPTEKIWYYDLSDIKVGKKTPLAMDRFDDFFKLLPTRADSDRSWTVTREEIEARNYDLKAVNPNAKADEDSRKPEELLDVIEARGKEVAEALAKLRSQ